MRDTSAWSETELERLEQRRDPESVPHLVATIRQQQQELESLRLGMDVARRDREELRHALLAARAELERVRSGGRTEERVASNPEGKRGQP